MDDGNPNVFDLFMNGTASGIYVPRDLGDFLEVGNTLVERLFNENDEDVFKTFEAMLSAIFKKYPTFLMDKFTFSQDN